MFSSKRIPLIYWVLTLCIIQDVLYGLTADARVEGIVAPYRPMIPPSLKCPMLLGPALKMNCKTLLSVAVV